MRAREIDPEPHEDSPQRFLAARSAWKQAAQFTPVHQPALGGGGTLQRSGDPSSLLHAGRVRATRHYCIVHVDHSTDRRPSVSRPDDSWYRGVVTKQTTVRLPEELADQAEVVARVQGTSLNTLIVESLAAEVERVRADRAFTKKARQLIERDKELLERLAK